MPDTDLSYVCLNERFGLLSEASQSEVAQGDVIQTCCLFVYKLDYNRREKYLGALSPGVYTTLPAAR